MATFIERIRVQFGQKLDEINPRRICNRSGHQWIGFNSMGPHRDHGGGEFYALRYRIACKRCKALLEDVPQYQWPGDGQVERW